MWSPELKCRKCDRPMTIHDNDESIICDGCGQTYETIENELFHASFHSGSGEYYDITDDWKIKRIFFDNQPCDLLEEAYETSRFCWSGEKRPSILAPVVKNYYDALKKRLQVYLSLGHIPNLTSIQKENINSDNPMRSILDLIDLLPTAFPTRNVDIAAMRIKYETILKRAKWVRDKYEHTLIKLWPMPAKIFEAREDEPNSSKPPLDILDYDFILEVNTTVVDIYIFLLDLELLRKDENQYEIIEAYRLVKTTT